MRFLSGDGKTVQWRLWIGSRNLTRDVSWDAGLVLVTSDSQGAPIAGVGRLGKELLGHVGWDDCNPAEMVQELDRVSWRGPEGVTVEEIMWLTKGGATRLPEPPNGLSRLVVVSPFLEAKVVKELGAWPAKRRTLISCVGELAQLAHEKPDSLSGFAEDLLTLDTPASDATSAMPSGADGAEAAENPESDLEARGLHAKLIYAEHRRGQTLWIGSANATSRAWNGRNCEIVARLKVDGAIGEGITALEALARPWRQQELPPIREETQEEETLEKARKELAGDWPLKQLRLASGTVLTADRPPLLPAGMLLFAAPVGGDFVEWPTGQTQVALIPFGEESALVQLRLQFGPLECSWLQGAPLDPPPTKERDRRIIASFLDARTFLSWLRALLTEEDAGEGGGPWHEPTPAGKRGGGADRFAGWAPTLEDALKAWRPNDFSRLESVDRHMCNYLEYIRRRADCAPGKAERLALDAFEQAWAVIRKELLR